MRNDALRCIRTAPKSTAMRHRDRRRRSRPQLPAALQAFAHLLQLAFDAAAFHRVEFALVPDPKILSAFVQLVAALPSGALPARRRRAIGRLTVTGAGSGAGSGFATVAGS